MLEVYSDSGHASDAPYDTRSQTGVLIMLNGTPVYWASRKQTGSVYSSAAAEIYALSEAVRCARFYKWCCHDMAIGISGELVVQVDNKQAESFHKGTCLNSRLRGVFDLREAWVRELRDDKQLQVKYVAADKQLADVLTKALPAYKFRERIEKISPTVFISVIKAIVHLALWDVNGG